MSLAVFFWVLMLLALVFGIYSQWRAVPPPMLAGTSGVLLFLLLVALGWGTFGAPIK